MCSRCYFVIKSIGTNMIREFTIFLCAGIFVCGGATHTARHNAPAKDHAALPSESSYKKVRHPSSKFLPTPVPTYEVNSAVVDTIAESAPVKSLPVYTHGSSNAKQQSATFSATVAADPSSPEYKNILERYQPAVEPIKPYFAAPVAAKSVTIGSYGESIGPAAPSGYGQNVRPIIVYTSNAAPPRPQYTIPLAQSQTALESHGTVNVYPRPSYNIQHVAPVVYATHSAGPREFAQNNGIVQSHEVYTAHSPAYQVEQVQTVNVQPPAVKYVASQPIAYDVKPVVKTIPVAKKVTIESHGSENVHPLPAPRYPVPAPVVYQEVRQPVVQQIAVAPTVSNLVETPRGHSVPVLVSPGRARVQYHPIPVHGGHQHGYAKAVVFSPASEVSRVSFNGLGVTYGWGNVVPVV